MKQKLIQKNSPSHAAPLKVPNSSKSWELRLEEGAAARKSEHYHNVDVDMGTMTNDLMDQGLRGQMSRVGKGAVMMERGGNQLDNWFTLIQALIEIW